MTDMEKVIKGLMCCLTLDSPCGDCPYYSYEDIQELDCERNLRHDAIAMLKEQDGNRWISVTERLPKSMANKVIVYLQHEDLVPYIGYGHYEKFHGEEMWYDLENNEQFSKRGYTVTHWMQMPNSPQGEKLIHS